MCSLGKTLLAFVLLHCVLKVKLTCFSRYLLTSYFCSPILYDEKKTSVFLALALEGLGGLHRTLQPQLLEC